MANNLEPVNQQIDLNSEASTFFNNYFKQRFTVSSNVNDAILAHFEQVAENRDAARILASAVIYTSIAQRVDPITTLDKFRTLSGKELATYTAMFLNLNRKNSSLLGLTNRPQVSKYVSRSILP